MVEIRWSIQSLEDIESITLYISKESPKSAIKLIDTIITKIEYLKDFPHFGRKVPEKNDENIRELLIKKYRVVYELRRSVIEIITVSHGCILLKI